MLNQASLRKFLKYCSRWFVYFSNVDTDTSFTFVSGAKIDIFDGYCILTAKDGEREVIGYDNYSCISLEIVDKDVFIVVYVVGDDGVFVNVFNCMIEEAEP